MASLDDLTPEQLQDYLSWAKGENTPSTGADAASASEDSQFLGQNASNAEKPIAKLGDVIDSKSLSTPKPNAQDIVNSQSIPGKSASDSAKVFEGMPRTAAESAETFEGMPSEAATSVAPEVAESPFSTVASKFPSKEAFANFLDKLKGNAPKSFEEGMNMAGKGARAVGQSPVGKEALNVLKGNGISNEGLSALGEAAGAGLKTAGKTAGSALSTAGELAGPALSTIGKLAGPAGLAYSALESPEAGAADLDYSPSTKELMNQHLPLPNGGLTGDDLDKYIAEHPGPNSPSGSSNGPSLFDMGGEGTRKLALQQASKPQNRSTASTSGGGDEPSSSSSPSGPQFQTPSGPSPLDRLRTAYRQADFTTAMNQLGQAGAQIGSGIPAAFGGGMVAPTQVNDKIFDTNIALAQKLPERVGEELKMERMDPKSETSVSARNFIKTNLGVNVPDNISADQLKEQFPVIEKYLQAKENARVRIETAKQHNELMQAMRSQAQDDRHNTQDNHDFAKLGEKLTAGLASSRNTLGRTDNTIRAATALEGLKARIKDPNNMTTQEIAELATGVNSMLTQGMGSDHGVKMILPTSAQGDVSKVQAYISGIPQGAQQGAFVQRLYNTIETEKNIAKQIQGQIKTQAVAGYTHLKDRNPGRWNELMSAHGLGADEPGMSSGPIPQTQVPQQGSNGPKAGSIVKVRGKTYQVGADGDSLTEIQQ